jgi:UDP-3-O-[3-hydroxymyristoyl] glucosamine N-acyltransferase
LSSRVSYRVDELARLIGGEVNGDGAALIKSAAPIEIAQKSDLTFVANPKYRHFLQSTHAGAIIVAHGESAPGKTLILHKQPHLAFAQAVRLLNPVEAVQYGRHATAVIDSTATVGKAEIGALVVIEAGAKIGDDVVIAAGSRISKNVSIGNGSLIGSGVQLLAECKIGERVLIHPGVVIGADGFGFAESPTGLYKVPQVGSVRIGNDVEIGANTTIDRGALGDTVIGNGTKIDNLVMIAHNVQIGSHCVIVAQTGIAGSTKIGDRVMIAGQVGIIGHLEIGHDVKIAAQSGVGKSIPDGQTVLGTPAHDIHEQRRMLASLRRLPEIIRKLNTES